MELKPADRLDFNEVFLLDAATRGITITNNSNLKAKFQVEPQKEESKLLAKYKVNLESGDIEPNGNVTIQVTLVTKRLGEISLPLSILIVGANNGVPYVLNISCFSQGPIVEICNNIKELDFGTVNVLQDYHDKVTIKNKSTIEADFHAFTKDKKSPFKPILKHGLLQPGESTDIEIICCCDDARKF